MNFGAVISGVPTISEGQQMVHTLNITLINYLAYALFKCILSYRTKIADKSKTSLVHEKDEGLIILF